MLPSRITVQFVLYHEHTDRPHVALTETVACTMQPSGLWHLSHPECAHWTADGAYLTTTVCDWLKKRLGDYAAGEQP